MRPALKGKAFAVHYCEKVFAATNPDLVDLPVAEVTVHLEKYDRQADRAQLEALARWCDQFSPIVGIEGESLLLDVTGLPFDAEQVTKALWQQGFVARVVVAETIGAAWARAHCDEPLPAYALRLEKSTLEKLMALGIHYVSELQQLPRDQLAARFEEVVKRLDQLTGAIVEPVVPYREPPEIVVERSLEYPLESCQLLAAVCNDMIVEVARELSFRQQGAARLEVVLNNARLVIGLFQPSDSPRYLRELVEMQLERVRLDEAVTRICVAVLIATPLRARQRELFNDGHDRERQLGMFVDCIRSRSPALRAVLVADAQPEHAVRYEPLTNRKQPTTKLPRGRRPLLVEPKPIPVDAISGTGPPQQFTFRGETHRTVQAWGPERILTGWWRDGYIRRDYYRVETTSGGCYWLFRARSRWFLHGVF